MKNIAKQTFTYLVLIASITFAQQDKVVKPVTLKDVNSVEKKIPYSGEKVTVIFYIDPDEEELKNPLTDALDKENFPTDKLTVFAIINCEDTWLPNAGIRAKAKKRQTEFPKSIVLLDEDHTLQNAWHLGDANNKLVVLIIGKDSKIKFAKTVKSMDESKASARAFIGSIKSEMNLIKNF